MSPAQLDDAPSPRGLDDRIDGVRIGPYRLVKELGRGGMGTVYLAVRSDDAFQKRVALKVLKRGMDTDAIVRRFRNERQILASLDHPNIAACSTAAPPPTACPTSSWSSSRGSRSTSTATRATSTRPRGCSCS